tara:strand:+ start:208 stop:2424 length:2217 start_codon:yes stop_codon:yes gene_type:complete
MARISTYTIDSSIDGTEFVLGREADGTTKQFSMSALQTFLATSIQSTTVFGSIDVNGGAIDGTVIGGSSAAAGSFTTISASSNATITGNATVGGTLGVTGVTTMVDVNVTGEINFDGAPGTAGQYLQSSGDGITPVWDTLSLNDLSDVLIADNSLYIGHDPTATDSTAQFNIAVGATALNAITTGDQNIAIGHDAAGALTTGTSVVAIGYNALAAATTGSVRGVYIGDSAGAATTIGTATTAVGYNALLSNTEGTYNTAIGDKALRLLNKVGSDVPTNNTAVGAEAGNNATYGDQGTYIGSQAGSSVTTASNNTLVGALAGKGTTTGADNVAVGAEALDTNTTGSRSVAIGYQALYTSDTASSYNVAVGYKAGYATNTGVQNAFVGYAAGIANTTGSNNIALGSGSLLSNTIGNSNVSLGKASLAANVDGSKSVAVGELSLTTQDPSGAADMHNVAVGYQAGTAVTTGTQNTLIGNLSGDVVTTGSGNTSLGYNTAFSANSASNQTVIGNGATGQGDNIVVIGNSSVTSINPGNATVSLGTTTNPYQDIFVSRNIKSSLDSSDLAITQFDGNEVARIHDGGTNQNTGALNALGHGFGFKMPIMILSADGGDKTLTLDAKQSGSIIQCDADTNNIVFNLPVIDASNKAGITYTFVNTTAVDSGHTVIINTNGTDGNDKFLMYGFNGATSITDVAGDTLTIPNSAAIGTVVRITCLASGASNAAEIWLAEVFGASAVTNA